MGMFDSIFVDCPGCGAKEVLEYQSKSGDCILGHYTLQTVPSDVLTGHHGYAAKCHHCQASFNLVVKARKMVVAYECRLVNEVTGKIDAVVIAPYKDNRQIEVEDDE